MNEWVAVAAIVISGAAIVMSFASWRLARVIRREQRVRAALVAARASGDGKALAVALEQALRLRKRGEWNA